MSTINKERLPKIQFITHSNRNYNIVESALLALSCGIRWIQFRCKEYDSADALRNQALRVRQLCRQYKALFVIDDYVELAKELQADGVHLGKNDMPVDQARKFLGNDFLIGGTANTIEDMHRIAAQGGDYIGLGPYRFTATKERLSPLLGPEGYAKLIDSALQQGIDLPVYAIGGILPEDAPTLKKCRVYGLAISSAILQAENPQAQTDLFVRYFIREEVPSQGDRP